MNKKIIQNTLGVVYILPLLMFANMGGLTAQAAPARAIEVNIFYPGAAYNIQSLTSYQANLGVPFTSSKWYMDWSQSFDSSVANRFHNAGYIPELTWQPQVSSGGVPDAQVTGGSYDTYLNQVAQSVKTLGYTIRISLAPEMNGDWAPWGVTKNGNTNLTHKAAFQYVVQKFRSAGATNVQWIWAPNVHTYGEVYTFAQIFPGDTYVDYVGLDGYNWGTSQTWSTWQSFSAVFDSSYRDLVAISSKPVLIMEMASTERGGNKASWILDMFSTIRANYPRIQGFTWFNENKETDWRIESSLASKQAFINGYNGSVTPSPTPTATPTPSATPTANASSKPSPTPSVTATASSTPSATPTATSAPTPTSTPANRGKFKKVWSSTSNSWYDVAVESDSETGSEDQTEDSAVEKLIERNTSNMLGSNNSNSSHSNQPLTNGALIGGAVLTILATLGSFVLIGRHKATLRELATEDSPQNSGQPNAQPQSNSALTDPNLDPSATQSINQSSSDHKTF